MSGSLHFEEGRPVVTIHRPQDEERAALVIPPPRVAQWILADTDVEARGFPSSPKRTWLAGRRRGRARMTYSVGPWMSADFRKVLEPEAHTLILWVIADDGRLRAMWISRDGKTWAFENAWISPPTRRANSKEMMTWLTG